MKSPERRLGAFGSSYAVGLRAAAARVGLARREISHWRLAPLPFTGRGWKLRSSSQRRTWCLEKRTFDSIRE
jgi:hypothetical protein